MPTFNLELVFNEASYPEVTFVQPKEYPYIKSAFRAEGKHITLSGPSGSGKTTLIMSLLRDLNISASDRLMFNGRSHAVVESIFQVLGHELGTEPTFEGVTPYLQLVKFVVIDDFHHLSLAARTELAKHLKLWHENGVRFVIIGIASSANELIGTDAELGIRNDPFELKTQDEDFVRKLINLGEQALNIAFSEEFKLEIVAGCNGVPSIIQESDDDRPDCSPCR
jgi:Cdc6-like AAA superfamily ATPase